MIKGLGTIYGVYGSCMALYVVCSLRNVFRSLRL